MPEKTAAVTGPEILERRKVLDMTQQELGEALGVHWTTISRWERGEIAIANPRMVARALRDLERNRRRRRKAPATSERRASIRPRMCSVHLVRDTCHASSYREVREARA